jgi:pimeloyl-ACP methyl ester carboxylesterase
MPVASGLYYYAFQGGELESLPVVLIHGAGGNHLYWPLELRRLPGYRIFALDLPGHGKSAGQGHQSIGAYVGTVLEWLGAMSLNRAVFVGHSMGGAIAMGLGIHYPEHVLGLGLVASGSRLRVDPELLMSTSSPTTFTKAIDFIIEESFSPSTDAQLVEIATKRLAETRPSVLYGDFLACDTFDVVDQLKQIRKPTLLVCGGEDKMTPPRYSQHIAGEIPGARLEIIPQAGHMVMLEQPVAVATALARFLAEIPYLAGE